MEELIWDQTDRFTEDAHSVFERLQDDESKKLFEMRYELMLENPYIEPWINKILPMYKDWHPEKIIDDNRDSIVIYGCGKDGILISRILKAFGIKPICFCISEGGARQ
ncbi:MAG: hypothetical protein IJI65_06965 [Lachnospiraceae bacterium]|nr:hypothetical protein [Lachnospiraceae bacterium]